jgi:hypothetical protein
MGHHRLRSAAGASPADPYFSSTSLLLLGNGTNGGQNNTFVDSSTNNFTVTRNGNTTQGSFSPFTGAGGSGYFDGSGDYLSVSSFTDIGSGDYTFECWANSSAASFANYQSILYAVNSTGLHVYFGGANSGGGGSTSNGILAYHNGTIIFQHGSISLSTWTHIAIARSGSTVRLFIDGTLIHTVTSSANLTDTSYRIGSFSTSQHFNGYISNLRILKGTAQYTATFTPPTSPLTAITNTSLLLNFTNGSILDSTAKNNLETVGDAQVSTSVKKFGTGSLKFDGTGDYLSVPSTPNLAFGTGDFTIELWAYLNSQDTFIIYDPRTTEPQIVPVIYTYLGQIKLYVNGADRIAGSTLSAATWYHIAVSRSGSSTKLFVNGTQSGSTYSDSNNYIQTRVVFCVYPGNLTSYFNGYLDDIRITKGVARYTSNFTPPSAQLPAR